MTQVGHLNLTFADVVYKKTISQHQLNMIFVVFVLVVQFAHGLAKDMVLPMHARIVHTLVHLEALYLEQLATQVAVMELPPNVDVPTLVPLGVTYLEHGVVVKVAMKRRALVLIHVLLEAPYQVQHVQKHHLMKQPITVIMLVQMEGH